MRRSGGAAVAVLGAVLGLGACTGGTVQEAFGIDRRAPDEFQVVRRQPLIVPPNANLRPPQPGAPTLTGTTADDALAALTGQTARPGPAPVVDSPAQQALVDAAPGQILPNVRNVVANEDTQVTQLDRGTFLFILDFQRDKTQQNAEVLDPQAERERLAAGGTIRTTRTSSTPLAP